jgi:hypothetical protein
MEKPNPVAATYFFLFKQARFDALSTQWSEVLNREDNQLNVDRPDNVIRKSLSTSFLTVVATIILGFLIGSFGHWIFGALPTWVNRALQYGGVGILLWATLAKLGWNIQTFSGRTLPELVDVWIYRALYVIGSFALVVSVSWPGE